MAIFDKLKEITIAQRKSDEALYSIVAQEMEDGIRHQGLWLKALGKADGNKEKQISEYIKLRVQSLKDDVSILSDSDNSEQHISQERDIEEFVTMLSGDTSVEMVVAYFSGMDSLEIKNFINLPDACEEYPIHISIKKGRGDLARWLLGAGANPQMINYWGKTPLEIAVSNDDQDAIAVLEQFST